MHRAERNLKVRRKNSDEGTSARTRPFSFEEIMLRRKRNLATDFKEKTAELNGFSERVDAKLDFDQLKNMEKGSSRKMEDAMSKKERYKIEDKDKGNHDSEAVAKGKTDNNNSSKDKENKIEKLSYHRSRNSDRMDADSKREREKKRPTYTVENDKYEVRDRKSRKEEKRKHSSHMTEKIRSDFDDSYSKKRVSDTFRDTEYSERNDRKKERSQAYNEEKPRRRRSRSREYNQERDRRSPSVSPRVYKRSHRERDYGESSLQSYKDKPRRKNSEADDYRSGNGEHAAHHQKHGNRLGGYSPRKRKTEAAVRTPSPTICSPDRKTATWDRPPARANHAAASGSALVDSLSPDSKVHELAPSIISAVPQVAPLVDTVSLASDASVDSIQLTQATRPMRRLYIENLPPSVSEKKIIDCFNDFLLSSGVNFIAGTKPCINCILNNEKSLALVEFLTPEDATTAFSFDGRSLSGSVLKIRRPRDFVEAATGVPEKPLVVTKVISDVVKDSPNKIFIGGISRALSSDMLMEIVNSFGVLRAYHFECNEDLNVSFAFLEYTDHSITLKACAGLNGMKLGGHVITAVQATPDVDADEGDGSGSTSYDVPMHAKPLLEDATQVLQLKNVFSREDLSSLSEAELAETLEDIRLECSRFGTVKSVNIVRYEDSCEIATDALDQETIGDSSKLESRLESPNGLKENGGLVPPADIKEIQNVADAEGSSDKDLIEIQKNELPVGSVATSEAPPLLGEPLLNRQTGVDNDVGVKVESPDEHISLVSEMPKSEVTDKPAEGDALGSSSLDEVGASNVLLPVESENLSLAAAEGVGVSNNDVDHQDHELDVFEPGSVLVEFLRKEATCMAAHCLYGRSYGERIVMVGYVPGDSYKARFRR